LTAIRKLVYAALLALSAMSLRSNLAAAQEPAHGKFTLIHNVNWGNAVVPAGDYEFSYDPYQTSVVLTLTKLSGTRAGFMLLVTNFEDSKPSDSNQLLLESIGNGSYVSAMQLANCGMTLRFNMPSHPLKQMAKAVPSGPTSGQ
jgi:hypothetical protein